MVSSSSKLSTNESEKLLKTLQTRFEKHANRHHGISWAAVKAKLEKNPSKLFSIHEMERTGGEPDVVLLGKKSSEIVFVDSCVESPSGRRSLCYDDEALRARKENKPKKSAVKMAHEMGVELLNEEEYLALQELGDFDLKTSSWLKTPSDIRKKGGAIFGDKRYGRVFTYHNGADSYYSARGFRGKLKI